MNVAIEIERNFGYRPKDVCAKNVAIMWNHSTWKACDGDLRSMRFASLRLRRKKSATIVTVSENEILTALNKPEEFILAIVAVDGDQTHMLYLKRLFRNAPDFTVTSVNYDIEELRSQAECIFKK